MAEDKRELYINHRLPNGGNKSRQHDIEVEPVQSLGHMKTGSTLGGTLLITTKSLTARTTQEVGKQPWEKWGKWKTMVLGWEG